MTKRSYPTTRGDQDGEVTGAPADNAKDTVAAATAEVAAVRGGAAVNQAAEAAVNPHEVGNAFTSNANAKSTSSGNAQSSSVRGAERKAIMSRYANMWLKP